MKFRQPLIAVIAVLLLGLLAAPVSAQTPAAQSIPPIDEFEGIQAAVSRTYGLDVEAMLAATPDLGPEDFNQGVNSASVMALQFDSAENAAAAMQVFRAGIGDQLLLMGQAGTPTITDEDIENVGTQASATTLHTDTDDFETWYRFVLVQDGEYFFVISSLAGASEYTSVADSLAEYVVTTGEVHGEEAIFVADGASSGGLWDLMPPAGDPALQGLIAVVDETLFPAPTE